jgi:hypothetical protein
MQNQRILKQIATLTVEGTRRRERPRKRWRGEVEEDLTIMGIKKTGTKLPETVGNGGTFEHLIGSRGQQRTIALEKEEEENDLER